MLEPVSNFPDLGAEKTQEIIAAAIEIHRELGPGLLESVYETCLFHELADKGFDVQKQCVCPVTFKGRIIDEAYRIDLLVDDEIVIELKAVEQVLPIHRAQIISYMKLGQFPLGLLMNFNKKLLSDGIQRFALSEFERK